MYDYFEPKKGVSVKIFQCSCNLLSIGGGRHNYIRDSEKVDEIKMHQDLIILENIRRYK